MAERNVFVTREELRALIREAIREELIIVGLHAATPEQAEEARQDFAFVRFMRRTRDTMGRAIANAILLALVSGVAGLLWLGFRAKVGQ
jgi:hypothetical protein